MTQRPDRTSIVTLMREGVLDAELAALLWLLAEAGVPVTVASPDDGSGRAALVSALDELVPPAGPRPIGMTGASLEEVMARPRRRALPMLGAPGRGQDPIDTGVVLVVGGGRIVAAHYVRPPLRDAAGHLRRQGPAVLATWDEDGGRFDHFAWGVYPELAQLVGRRAGDFEHEHVHRAEYLAALAASDVEDVDDLRAAIRGYRLGPATARDDH